VQATSNCQHHGSREGRLARSAGRGHAQSRLQPHMQRKSGWNVSCVSTPASPSGPCWNMTRLLGPIIAFPRCRIARRRDRKAAREREPLTGEKLQHLFPCHPLISGFPPVSDSQSLSVAPQRSLRHSRQDPAHVSGIATSGPRCSTTLASIIAQVLGQADQVSLLIQEPGLRGHVSVSAVAWHASQHSRQQPLGTSQSPTFNGTLTSPAHPSGAEPQTTAVPGIRLTREAPTSEAHDFPVPTQAAISKCLGETSAVAFWNSGGSTRASSFPSWR